MATDNDYPEILNLRPDDLDELLTRAAGKGAERALAALGLENGHAAKDIRDLRGLIEAWRQARQTAWQTLIKLLKDSCGGQKKLVSPKIAMTSRKPVKQSSISLLATCYAKRH